MIITLDTSVHPLGFYDFYPDWELLGWIVTDDNQSGWLLRHKVTGAYGRLWAGRIRGLKQKSVREKLGLV